MKEKFEYDYDIPRLPKPITKEIYEDLFKRGVIRKKDLVIGKYYYGNCRNASVAKWDGKEFKYMRFKFGDYFIDTINHLEDDDGYDLFVPLKETEPREEEIIK